MSNTPNTPDALKVYKMDKTSELFQKTGIFSEIELEAHYTVMVENYNLKLEIEARVLSDLCKSYVLPACYKYQTGIAENIYTLKQLGLQEDAFRPQSNLLNEITHHINNVAEKVETLNQSVNKAVSEAEPEEEAELFCHLVKPIMAEIRESVDHLEEIVEDGLWPLAKYREMMFIR